MIEQGHGRDGFGVHAGAVMLESGRERTGLVVRKWDLEQTIWAQRRLDMHESQTVQERQFNALKLRPYEISEWEGNLITQVGWGDMFTGFFGSQASLFSTTVGRIGIGTSTSATVATDTALGSVSGMTGNNWILSGSNPTLASNVTPCTVVITASFGTTAAVGAWNEFAIDHGTASGGPTTAAVGHMINHSSWSSGGPGTKGAATWSATATLSFT
jgi:hypothetical protein